jgi:hypothetical protein
VLGTRAVRHDPEAGLCLADRLDGGRAREGGLVGGVAASQLDDRHVEGTDVVEELKAGAAVLGFLDLVAVGEQLLHAEADDRVAVNYQAASFVSHFLMPLDGPSWPKKPSDRAVPVGLRILATVELAREPAPAKSEHFLKPSRR